MLFPIKKSNAIIFDMDGVLFPTEGLKFMAYQEVFRTLYGIAIEETIERLGLSETKAMELFLNTYNKKIDFPKIPELIQKKREAYYNILAKQEIIPYAGAEDLLKIIKNSREFKIGLATSSDLKSTEILIKRFGFKKYFDSILSREQVIKPKPDPEVYLTSASLLKISPENCVVFEDSPTGLEAAGRAGMHKIGVTTGISKEKMQLYADLVINDFREINIEEIRSLLNKSCNKC